MAQERTVATPVATEQKLEATDERGLNDLNKAFDESFGPREGATAAPPEKPETKWPRAQTRPDAPGSRERPTPGHHAPVEVKRAPAAPAEDDAPLNLLGEREYQPRARERKPIEFDREIP